MNELCKQLFCVEGPSGRLLLLPYVELFWAASCEIEDMPTFRSSCVTGMRCWSAYLRWREQLGAPGQPVLEGQEDKIRWRSNIARRARRRAISSKHKLSERVRPYQIQLPKGNQGEAISGGGSVMRDLKQIYIFSKNLKKPYMLGVEVTHYSLICWKWCIVHHDPNFGDFHGP